jgi:hypothetical protein
MIQQPSLVALFVKQRIRCRRSRRQFDCASRDTFNVIGIILKLTGCLSFLLLLLGRFQTRAQFFDLLLA